MDFWLVYYSPGVEPQLPAFNRTVETAVFLEILDTFKWLSLKVATQLPPPHGVQPALINSTATLVPTFTPSETPTLRVGETPSPSPITFTPGVSPMEFNYKATLRACLTYNPQVNISVAVSNPSVAHGVILFFRLKNKTTGEETPWNAGLNMNPQGNGSYETNLTANQIPNLATISAGGVSAWLEYQFAATDTLVATIGRSSVYSDVSLTPCK